MWPRFGVSAPGGVFLSLASSFHVAGGVFALIEFPRREKGKKEKA
jgi:hypothetical protein